jgi:UDP-N-acetyl-2-amino-2-deoxyglucuronate dehydrogenase
LKYITSRGNWYQSSWKGDVSKAGGIATNIGIHFFDMLIWIFGSVKNVAVNQLKPDHASGYLELEKARVNWFLSINYDHLPQEIKSNNKRTFRSLSLEGKEIEFSEGFTDLHTRSYEEILQGKAFGLQDARPSIELTYDIRNRSPLVNLH